ncbi:unnamed protein product [Zymoseptoria tritici ST99CH_3D7]|uniref:Leucine rich repeat protein n=1 Tax=Zymoseptoria tritici (strain ST99CH_3D7) TaxID=1276538 RepID=A0A1X7RPW3_ZYMT9|nr:unnamed protein product [Zymoseptoria tritici ST99CH_3D7]
MNHHRLRRGFNALATSFSSKTRHDHKKGARQRPYKFGPISTSWTDLCDTDTDEEPTTSRSIMGGKSNKFDYTNRANSGAALGHIIARDLEKEATKAARGAERRDSRARKRSGSGIGGQDEVCHGGHVLDLKVPGKDLGDEGVIAMAEGLVSVLSEESVAAKIALEDLVLSDNAITTASLARLAPVIVLARYSLKTLNLANNNIKVETDEEAAEWEQLLRAFRGCYKLRRLDLSGNPELGAKAMEIFARVHMAERHITPMPAGGETSVVSLAEEMSEKAEVDTTTEMTADGESTNNLMAQGTVLKRRCGLRSIPYITLNNVGLTDRGAMFLSYVLEEHYYPSQLIDDLNAALPGSNIAAYQQDTNFSGIDWDEREPGLGRDGLHLLKKTELFRRQTMLEDDHGTLASLELTTHTSHGSENHPPNGSIRGSVDRRHSRALPGDRRTSIRSIRTADGGEHELSDLESARRRLQRFIIAADGANIVDLWRTGLRLVTSSRVLSGIGPLSRNLQRLYYSGPPRFDFAQSGTGKSVAARPVTPNPPAIQVTPSFDSGLSSPFTQTRKPSRTSTTSSAPGLAPDVSEQPLTDVTNTPETPKRNFKPHRKGAFSDGSDLHAVTQKLDILLVHSHDPQRFVRWQEERVAADPDAKRAFRDTRVPSHLPGSLRDRIAEISVSENEVALLSEQQRQDAIQWGRTRRNFETEKEWRKMADSAQVWTLLESIGCLDYHRGE